VTADNNAPPTAEENERADRQPGVKGHPQERGAPSDSADRQREAEPEPADRRSPSGLLDEQHRPGSRDRPNQKP
jgi:hypothetical protein